MRYVAFRISRLPVMKLVAVMPYGNIRGINFFQGQGGMKAGIDHHSGLIALWLCPVYL